MFSICTSLVPQDRKDLLSAFQNLTDQITTYRRKALQEFFHRVIVFQVFEESLHGHARAFEDRRAAENFRVDCDEVTGIHSRSLVQLRLCRKWCDLSRGAYVARFAGFDFFGAPRSPGYARFASSAGAKFCRRYVAR